GVLPLAMTAGEPIPDPRLAPGITVPSYAAHYPGPGEGAPETPGSRNVALIGRFYDAMWNRFDKGLFPELLTEDIRFRGSLGQHKVGYEELGEYVDLIQRAFPDFTNHVEEIVSEGDRSFARLTYRGTHRGAIFGIAPTGRRIEYSG